jgi:hypothetical protein
MFRLRLFRAAMFLIPSCVIALSYLQVCRLAGTWWPWFSVVHEDGVHTLLGTVLYFEHAARELPLDLLLGCGLAASTFAFFNLRDAAGKQPAVIAGLTAVLAMILLGAFLTTDAATVRDNLAQMHTRPGSPLMPGSHWRYHLLERLSLLLCGFALAGFAGAVTRCGRSTRLRGTWMALVLAVYGMVSLWFGITREPFLDPVYLGHQARELVTHALITVPLGFAVCLGFADCRPDTSAARGRLSRAIWIAAATGVVAGFYIVFGAAAGGAQRLGQQAGLRELLFPHVFEHAFTYLVVPLSGAAVLSFRRRFARPAASAAARTV